MKELVELQPSAALIEREKKKYPDIPYTCSWSITPSHGLHSITGLLDRTMRIIVERAKADRYQDWDTVRIIMQPETPEEMEAAGYSASAIECSAKWDAAFATFKAAAEKIRNGT